MAISFQLNLTPNQIEFLQGLALYADGLIDIGEVRERSHPSAPAFFISCVNRMQRLGLVEHVIPKAHQRYKGGIGGEQIIQAYRITDKGRAVLGIIESDVAEFMARQRMYQTLKKSAKKSA